MACEAIYCFDTASVRFAVYPDGMEGPRILAEVSENALRYLFGARGGADSLVRACANHLATIEAEALRRYGREPAKAIRLETQNFAGFAALSDAPPFNAQAPKQESRTSRASCP